jgi:hypothetical protein
MCNLESNIMRNSFISNSGTIVEKEFWKQFFEEVDKRNFLDAKFNIKNFGLRINSKYLKEGTKNYSLMYSRDGFLKMNNIGFNGKKWDGLNRLRNWCTEPDLAEKFYSGLNKKDLISVVNRSVERIDIPQLLKYRTPFMFNQELFQCIDLFK